MSNTATMTVAQLIAILQTMPQDYPVEINDNHAGKLSWVDQVDCFKPEDLDPAFPDDYPCVVIQTETWSN